MSDEPDSLILRALRRIESNVDAMREDIREIKVRVGFLEQKYGLMEQQMALVSTRMDRIENRLERIEKRLDLVAV